MNTARRILLVFVICVLAVGYLYQHSYSVRLTRNLSRLETQRQLLAEALDGVNADIVRLASFVRMDSLWVAQGRLPAPGQYTVVGQAVAMSRRSGSDAAAH